MHREASVPSVTETVTAKETCTALDSGSSGFMLTTHIAYLKEGGSAMHETAVSTPEEATTRCNSPGETHKKLERYLELLGKAHEASRLLETAGLLRDRVSPGIFQNVEMDYRKRLRDSQEELEREKRILWDEFREHSGEREMLEEKTARARERIRELVFRYVLGEQTAENLDKEREELTRQINEDRHRLTALDQIGDLFEIMGFTQDACLSDPALALAEESASAEPSGARTDPDISVPIPVPPEPEHPLGATGLQAYANTTPAAGTAEPPDEPPAPEPQTQDAQKPSAGRQYSLCVLNGSLKGDRISLIRGNMSMGRAADNDIRIDDPALGKSHAMIIYMDGKYHLKNLDALNRTYVNGIQVDSSLLKDGDIIVLGEIRIRVSAGESLQ